MAATTGQLGLVTPTQGDLSGTWGNTVNNGITEYTNIAIAGTTTFTGDGAVTLVNTTGDASATNIASTSAQYMIVRVTGTLTTAKIITFGSAGSAPYSKLYLVDNSATGGIVTFKAYGQTGVSVAVGEKTLVFYNGTDIVKVATTTSGPGDVVGPASATANGIALFNSTTGKLIKDSAASDGLIYGLTVGRGAGAVATNTVLGASALQANTVGANSTAIGYNALYSSNRTADTTAHNTAVGHTALYSTTTGRLNTAIGQQAAYSNTTGDSNFYGGQSAGYYFNGSSNVGIGNGALQGSTTPANNTGSNNVAIGYQSLQANTTASNNTAVGYQAGYSNTTGVSNVFLGQTAGYTGTSFNYNTFIGVQAGNLSTGNNNQFLGNGSGRSMTTGSGNSIIGNYSGNQGGLDIRTASNYIVLSDGDGNPRMYNNATDWYDAAGKLRAVPQSGSSKTSSYTLATTDVGEYILLGASGAIVIPDATFAAGDVITIFNNTASTATITCSITTAYIAGTFTDKATMTLAAAGVATVLFITSTLCVVSGNVT